jgi:alanine racemase
VAYVEEAVRLRAAGITVPIVVLAGFAPGRAAPAQHRLTPVVSTPARLERAPRCADAPPLPVHVKVDTGMTRLGFAPTHFDRGGRAWPIRQGRGRGA